ncbi:MAG: hypothetical protein IPJ77_18090 [Planctomycetes bacterium]|nr:hypothetical protein [Planctomycetota bacterium]
MHIVHGLRRHLRASRAGFTVLEVTISATVLVVGVLGMVTSVAASLKLVEANREMMVAHQAARALAEQMQNGNFSQVFAEYNTVTSDDPAGAGRGHGATFDVPGLRTTSEDCEEAQRAGGTASVGAIEFPTQGTALSESVVDAALGMPRDLNGDGVITSGAMPGSYLVLPVRIRLRWSGTAGTRTMTFQTLLVNR